MTRHCLLLKERHDRLLFEIGDGVTLEDYAEECEPGGIWWRSLRRRHGIPRSGAAESEIPWRSMPAT